MFFNLSSQESQTKHELPKCVIGIVALLPSNIEALLK